MLIDKHHIVLDEIEINREELIQFWQSFPQKCNLQWNVYKSMIAAEKNKTHRHQPTGEGDLYALYTPLHEGKQITEYKVIQDIIQLFNFEETPDVHDITFMTYKPGFQFKLHLDRFLEYNIMFPLLPKDNIEPIKFYQGNDKHNPGPLDYIHDYSTKHPTVFNGKTLHKVDTVKEFRMILRIKITSETFEEMIQRCKKGTFLKNALTY